jgi:hypothetical protein
LSYQCYDNLFVREHLAKLHHAPQVLLRKPLAELGNQLLRQCSNNLFAVFRPFLLKDVATDSLSHAPVEQDQRGVHLARYILSRFGDQLPEVAQQSLGFCQRHMKANR